MRTRRTLLLGALAAVLAGAPLTVTVGAAPHAAAVGPPILYFNTDDGTHGQELWVTDGTADGTRMVADINPSGSSAYYEPDRYPGGKYKHMPVLEGDRLYFGATDGARNVELWRTGGTADTTRPVADVHDGVGGSFPSWLTSFGGAVYFQARDGVHGRELWTTDGTAAGTHMVKDINPIGPSGPRELTVLNGVLYFTARDGSRNRELWRSDGTAGGTRLVKDINPNGPSMAAQLTAFAGELYFTARQGQRGIDLWRSDGTARGTRTVLDDVDPTRALVPRQLTRVGATLYFEGRIYPENGQPFWRLWSTDGTSAGTQVAGPDELFDSEWLTPFSGHLIFVGWSPGGNRVWSTDGTPEGTMAISGALDPRELTASGGYVYFEATNEANQSELWRTDGTADGTVSVNKSYPDRMTDVHGTLYYNGFDVTHKSELWRSDGTSEGTWMIADISPGWAAPNTLVPIG